MKRIFCAATMLIATTTFSVAQAQTGTQGPNGATTPDGAPMPSQTTPSENVTPPATEVPSSPTTPSTDAPTGSPGTTNSSQGVCNSVPVSSSNTTSGSTYTAGPSGMNTVERNSAGSEPSNSMSVPGGTSSTYSNESTSNNRSISSGGSETVGGIGGGSGLSSNTFRKSPATGYSNPNAPQIKRAYSDEVEYNNLVNTPQNIELYVGSSPLCYVNVTPLSAVIINDNIRVTDESGQQLGITVTKQENGGARISFAQLVPAGKTIKIGLQEVNYTSSLTPTAVQYSLAGGHTDFNQEIPYGIARFERFRR
jgi:hypothetical protein